MLKAMNSKALIWAAVFGALTLSASLARPQSLATASASRIPPPTTDPKVILGQALKAAGGEAWAKVRALHIRSVLAIGGREGDVDTIQDVGAGRYLRELHIPSGERAEGFDGVSV